MPENVDPETDIFLSRELVDAARWDVDAFATAVMRDEKTGLPLDQAPMHSAWHQLADEHGRLILLSAIEFGKAVPLTTFIPTPAGWKTMGELRVGDAVFGRDGRPCSITFATPPQFFRRVYCVRFDDGGSVLADADHLWTAQQNRHGRLRPWKPVTISAMLEAGLKSGRSHAWHIPLSAPVQYMPRTLLVHPYVLGAWLGDGDSAQPMLTFAEKDRAVYDRCIALEGGDCPPRRYAPRGVMRGNIGGSSDKRQNHVPTRLRQRLREIGVLNNKHIPESYLTASVEQRMELLRGLLDTDGYIGGRNPRVEYTSVKEVLAAGVLELVRSLGFKATMLCARATLRGRDVGPKFRVGFTAGTAPVFHLPRKLAALRAASLKGRATYRTIISIEEVPSMPVRCIQVDSSDYSYLMGCDYTVTHNSTQLAVARTLFLLGRDSTLRIAIVSNTASQSEKLLKTIKRYIEASPELHAVFPELRPTEDQWTGSKITVRRDTISKDPSVQAFGMHGAVLGARLDVLIIDDILDVENTRTARARDDCYQWVQAALLSRLTSKGRVVCVGTPFHPEDAIHRLARLPGWKAFRYPVVDDAGAPRWPERWPSERIGQKRDELGPLEFARQLMCVARSDEESRFKKEWLDACLARGDGKTFCFALERVPAGYKTYTGVDLAVQQQDSADWTVLFTIAVHGNDDREVLNIERGRWTGPEIVTRIIDHHRRYHSLLVVENNACFPPGTRVLTRQGYKPIESVGPGDTVWTHRGRWRRVLRITSRPYDGELVVLRSAGNTPVSATPNHAFWARQGGRILGARGAQDVGKYRPFGAAQWASVSTLPVGEAWDGSYVATVPRRDNHKLYLEDGYGWAKVEALERSAHSGPVFNLVVEEDGSYVVEDLVAHNSQDFIVQFARGQFAVPIRPFTTGRNKAHPEFGVESLAAEMAGKKWIIPSHGGQPAHPEIFQWMQEMLFYAPSAHTGDSLMAAWFAREGARMGSQQVRTMTLNLMAR